MPEYEWDLEYSTHGFGEVNEDGRELLTSLSLNEATICNTLFMIEARPQ